MDLDYLENIIADFGIKMITVKQYLTIFKYSNLEELKHIRKTLARSILTSEDMKNRYEAVKIALGEK